MTCTLPFLNKPTISEHIPESARRVHKIRLFPRGTEKLKQLPREQFLQAFEIFRAFFHLLRL